MFKKELIKQLEKYKDTDQIFVYSDSEGNDIKSIDSIEEIELNKSNNEGTFDAIVIIPTDQSFEANTDCKCKNPTPMKKMINTCNYCWGKIKT